MPCSHLLKRGIIRWKENGLISIGDKRTVKVNLPLFFQVQHIIGKHRFGQRSNFKVCLLVYRPFFIRICHSIAGRMAYRSVMNQRSSRTANQVFFHGILCRLIQCYPSVCKNSHCFIGVPLRFCIKPQFLFRMLPALAPVWVPWDAVRTPLTQTSSIPLQACSGCR